MAILAFQTPVSGLRGKIGGQVFSANGSGPYLKAWAKGSNPRSTAQTLHRASLVTFSQAWRGLSGAQQADWDTYAALAAQDLINSLSETYSVPGFSWFITLNLARAQNDQAQLSDAPVLGTPPASEANKLRARKTDGTSETNIQLPGGSINIDKINVIKCQVLNSIGTVQAPEIRTFMTAENFGEFATVLRFQDELEAAFGTIQVSQKIFVTIQIQNDEGRRGPALAFSDDVAL